MLFDTKENNLSRKTHYTAPACGFWVWNLFQFSFCSNHTAGVRGCWVSSDFSKLKCVKRFSVNFSFSAMA
ncbi:hypothetical protein AYY17_03330 [Morganella psychrotolerans]|uniref:Uncharacterized protein n=1 Tax=Morganella psychrotolerans TaxID=368603 RepID=A0A1B8HQX1_9GAMM|nr:hypothetical protein AYY17_03330 [Morganella psychrotolerans]